MGLSKAYAVPTVWPVANRATNSDGPLKGGIDPCVAEGIAEARRGVEPGAQYQAWGPDASEVTLHVSEIRIEFGDQFLLLISASQ